MRIGVQTSITVNRWGVFLEWGDWEFYLTPLYWRRVYYGLESANRVGGFQRCVGPFSVERAPHIRKMEPNDASG